MTKMITVAIDDGSSNIKACSHIGTPISFPASIQAGKASSINIGGVESAHDNGFYCTEEGSYTVGSDLSAPAPTGNRSYQTSPENRVLISHCLNQLIKDPELQKAHIQLITSLPFNAFYLRNGEVNHKIRDQKVQNLTNNCVKNRHGVSFNISRCKVVAEGLGAWFDLAFKWNEDQSNVVPVPEYLNGSTAIVDIGGHTTDIVVVSKGVIDSSKSTTIADSGMLSVYQSVTDEVLNSYPDLEDSNVNLNHIREAVDNNTPFKIWGKKVDLTKPINDAKSNLGNKITSNLRNKLAQGAQFDNVVFVGGGAHSLTNQLSGSFKNMLIHNNPSFANAEGMLKFAALSNK